MTEPTPDLSARLRHGATSIHSIGPVRAADLMNEAAAALTRPTLQVAAPGTVADRLLQASAEYEADGQYDLASLLREGAFAARGQPTPEDTAALAEVRRIVCEFIGRDDDPARSTAATVKDALACAAFEAEVRDTPRQREFFRALDDAEAARTVKPAPFQVIGDSVLFYDGAPVMRHCALAFRREGTEPRFELRLGGEVVPGADPPSEVAATVADWGAGRLVPFSAVVELARSRLDIHFPLTPVERAIGNAYRGNVDLPSDER